MQRTLDVIKESLGVPDFDNGKSIIYRGDCIEFMERMPNALIPLTVTSPPYNIGKEYEKRLTLEEYLDWTSEWLAQVYRITEETGSFWLNVGYVPVSGKGKAVPLPYLLWDKTDFFMLQEVVWTYGAGVAARKTFSPRNEKFLWYVKDDGDYTFNLDDVRDPDVKYPNQKKNGKLKCNPLGKNPGDVWSIPKVTSGRGRASVERTPHPAQFPEALIERVILASSNPGDVILDPFLGSGTTAVVANRLGRLCVGFELREDYLKVASERIKDIEKTAVQEPLEIFVDDGELMGVS